MAVTSLIILAPILLLANAVSPAEQAVPLITMLIAMPIGYFIFGYISVVIGCWVYNMLAKFTGGIEFETQNFEP